MTVVNAQSRMCYVLLAALSTQAAGSEQCNGGETGTSPFFCILTTTTFMPHMTADAGLVPCALTGTMHTLRWLSPLACRQVDSNNFALLPGQTLRVAPLCLQPHTSLQQSDCAGGE